MNRSPWMPGSSRWLAALLCTVLASPMLARAQEPSFDCAKAQSWAERAICIEPSLAELDRTLAAAYQRALERSSQPAVLRSEQLNWTRTRRDTCTHAACLKQAYAARLRELAPPKQAAAALVMPGLYQRFRFGKPDPSVATLRLAEIDGEEFRLSGEAGGLPSAGSRPAKRAEKRVDARIETRIRPQAGLVELREGECRMTMLFAPGLISVRDSTAACSDTPDATFDGDYRRVGK